MHVNNSLHTIPYATLSLFCFFPPAKWLYLFGLSLLLLVILIKAIEEIKIRTGFFPNWPINKKSKNYKLKPKNEEKN